MPQMLINNFTRGQLDHDLNGRFDMPFYANGFEVCRNFISNYKGNIKFRTGLSMISAIRGNVEAVLHEFKFNTTQAYLLEFTEGYLRFYTYDAQGNFGYVVDNNNDIVELNTGITLAQAKTIKTAQNADVMYIVAEGMNPKKLKRTSANSFTIENVVPTGINFSTAGYPRAVAFYSARLWYGGFEKEPLNIYGSKSTDYDNFTIPASPKAEDPLKLVLSDITDPITWIDGGNKNLYVGNSEGATVVNGGTDGQPITSTEVQGHLANHEGSYSCMPVHKDSQLFYVSNDQRVVYMFDYDLMTEKFKAVDLNWLSQEITKDKIKRLTYKKDGNYNLYALTEVGQLLVLLYNSDESINGWFEQKTDGVIADMCTVTRPDGKYDLFCATNRDGTYYLERLSDEVEFSKFYETTYFMEDDDKAYYNRLIAEELKDCVYLDASQTYEAKQNVSITYTPSNETTGVMTAASAVFEAAHVGHYIVYKTKTGKEYGYFKIAAFVSSTEVNVELLSESYDPATWDEWYISFNQITGLTAYAGKTVSVVADGGYYGDVEVTALGVLSIDRETTVICLGLPYTGLLKTFNLGMYAEGNNYQTIGKRISEFILRFVNSCGVKAGTDLASMQEVQYFSSVGFMDLPPLPMDGDEKRPVGDDMYNWKEIFIVQDKPLPMNLTVIQYNIDFGR
jgi:hypothetical protein